MIAPPATSSVFRQVRGLEVLTWPAFDAFGADVLVTTRQGGVSAGPYTSLNLSFNVGDDPASVLENRRRALAALGAGLDDAVFADQVHGAVAQVVGAADRGRGTRASAGAVPGADALVTADPGTVLAVLAADCVPVVLYDPVAHVLACAHAGWRGTVARAAAAAVAAMRSLGSRPCDVIAGIGPAVAPDRYQVGPEVAGAATSAFGDRAPDVLRATGPGQWQFDLGTANRLVLTEAGVPGGQIHASNVPTGRILATGPGNPGGPVRPTTGAGVSGLIPATDPSRPTGDAAGPFFSHRAERPCGRFAAMACLRAPGRAGPAGPGGPGEAR